MFFQLGEGLILKEASSRAPCSQHLREGFSFSAKLLKSCHPRMAARRGGGEGLGTPHTPPGRAFSPSLHPSRVIADIGC